MRSHPTMIPCACGCGTLIPSRDKSRKKRTYVNGHFWRGRSRAGQRTPVPAPERFWKHVQKTDECWVWIGGCHADGYGSFGASRGHAIRAHQYSWQLHNGPVPDGLCVLHICDNPPCVRPDQLFLGTKLDNARDREAKGRGRQPKGEAHHNAKLTQEAVLAIRARRAQGEFCRIIAADYNVTTGLVSQIARREAWKHVL